MSSRSEELVKLEPAVAYWRLKLAQSMMFTGDVQALLGQRAGAAGFYSRAEPLLSDLVAQDPKNQEWLVVALHVQLQQARLFLVGNDLPATTRIVAQTREKLQALVNAEPSSRVFTRFLATTWLLEARLRLAARHPAAGEAAARAVELAEPLIKEARADSWVIGEFAQANILAGRIAVQREVAQRHWLRALEVLTPRLPGSNDWRFLDPAAQALVLLGRTDDARPLIERLQRFGYHSSDPLAAAILDAAFPPVTSTHNQ